MASTNQHHTVLSDEEIVRRAILRFNRDCHTDGTLACQPSVHLSEVVQNVVTLRNVNGDLALYQITPSLRLRRISSVTF